MAYFNHAFQKVFLGTEGFTGLGEGQLGTAGKIFAAGQFGFVDPRTWTIQDPASAPNNCCPLVLVAGSVLQKDKIGPFHGGYLESNKSKMINPRYVNKFCRVDPCEAYLIMPGDNLDIKLFYNPELNENVTVRPDGMISLQLVDEIKAAGMSPQELSKVLTAKYSEELKKPAVTVIVKTFAAQRVFVGGEVNNQGLVAFQPGMTAMQAIMHAGGLKPTAYPEDTLVVRKGSDREPVVARIDLGMISEGIPGGQDVALHPEDLIIVPKSKIAKANQFVNQYIEQLLLFRGVSFGFNYRVNP